MKLNQHNTRAKQSQKVKESITKIRRRHKIKRINHYNIIFHKQKNTKKVDKFLIKNYTKLNNNRHSKQYRSCNKIT